MQSALLFFLAKNEQFMSENKRFKDNIQPSVNIQIILPLHYKLNVI